MPHMYALFLSGIMELVTVEPEKSGNGWVLILKTRKGFSMQVSDTFATEEDALEQGKSMARSYTAVHPMTIRHDPHGLAGRARNDED